MCQASVDAFHDYLPFELREASKHLHHHTTGSGLCFDCFAQAAERCACFIKLLEKSKQIDHRPGQPIQLADNQHVAFSDVLQCFVKLRTITLAARFVLVLVDDLATCLPELRFLRLDRRRLLTRRYSTIPNVPELV